MHKRAFILIHLAALFFSLDGTQIGKCSLRIRRSAIVESWQSSYFENFCFNNRSEDGKDNWNFFHTGDKKDSAVDGFHWFLISLKQTQMLRSVTIKSRGDPNHEVHFRAADIEIWSSVEDLSAQLGPNHCNSNKISYVFKVNSWKYCCKTKSNIIPGEYFDTQCNCQAKMLLLRKYVDNLTNWVHQCMNFENLWLNPIDRPSTSDKYKIITENGFCNAKSPSAAVKVIFESPDASAHQCSAFDSHGKQMNVTEVMKPTCDIPGNALRSEWLCHDCNSFSNATVRCRADSHNTTKLLENTCPKNNMLLAIMVILSILVVVLLGAIVVPLTYKKFREQSSSTQRSVGATSYPMIIHNRQVPQKPPLPPDVASRALAHSQLSVQTSAAAAACSDEEDEETDRYKNLTKLKTSECFYETVDPEQQFEMSQSSRLNSETTVYVEIVADGMDFQDG